MFSFFRRSKKAPDNASIKDVRDKKKSDYDFVKENSSSPTISHKDMCKNTFSTSQTGEIAPNGLQVTCSEVYANGDALPLEINESASSCENDSVAEIEPKQPKIEPNDIFVINSVEMDVNSVSANVKPTASLAPLSYASMLKKSDPPPSKPTHMVKPCGHGTLAVTPRIPPPSLRRDSLGTPPSSPKLELKNAYRKNASAPIPEIPSDKKNSGDMKTEEKINENEKPEETITASVKFSLNIPNLNTASGVTLSNNVPDKINKDRTLLEEADKKNLINQEAKFQSQLNDLSKQLSQRDAEVNKLGFQLEELQRDVFAKSAGMDRLQAELQAAQKESESLKQRLRIIDDDLLEYKKRTYDLADEISSKAEIYSSYEKEAKSKISELDNVILDLNRKIVTLNLQIEDAKKEKQKVECEHEQALADREKEKKLIEEALEKAKNEKILIDKKWEQEFEKLRTVNILKEQQLLDDFEWKLREVEKRCKKRLEEKDVDLQQRLAEACKDAEMKMIAAQEMMSEIEHIKSCKVEVEQLRGLTKEQEKSIRTMMIQQEQMQKAEESLRDESKRLRLLIDMEKENLQHMQRVHHQEIMEKERTLQSRLDEKKTEIAMYWEERLLHECSRLKTELEQLHNEEKNFAINTIRREKDEHYNSEKRNWEKKLQDSFKEIAKLKAAIQEQSDSHHKEMIKAQTSTDRDVMELRRLMNKIDMMHHEKYEKLIQEHDEEIERINEETEKKIKDIENNWQCQVQTLRHTLEIVKDQMERESQQKIQSLIHQHRSELDGQWENLKHQKHEAIRLVEEEYVNKYKTLEEQFYTQQKSHEAREVELLKTIDSLKNEIVSKDSTMDDLQNNVDTLEGGIQVLNQEIAQQSDQLLKIRRDSDYKIRTMQEMVGKLQDDQQQIKEEYENKLLQIQKQNQGTIDHLTRKCECLTKLFEEVRARYERRESRQEDLNIIADLRQVIAEQEKDLACINEEKRYFQMRLMNLEKRLEEDEEYFVDTDDFEEVPQVRSKSAGQEPTFEIIPANIPNGFQKLGSAVQIGAISIPPTIPECDDYDEC